MSIWWNSWADFWAMGRHGVYVWGSYAVAALLVFLEWRSVVRQQRLAISQLQSLHQNPEQDHP